ncbi:MAG: S-adenosylmethionine:tRNA ribosyltransferase-isomerase [Bacteroidota bacterium]|jgi:S-adenosylmethionine:tRNA ribosyltransferase-isomerase
MIKAVKDISVESFDYPLPEERIAKFPLHKRDESKLLVYQQGNISHTVFNKLPSLLAEGSMLVFNNTKVIHARMLFQKDTGAAIEIFCLEPVKAYDFEAAFHARGSSKWICMVGNAKRWKDEQLIKQIEINGKHVDLKAVKISQQEAYFQIEFSWNETNLTFGEIIDAAGILPLPPYLNRETTQSDETAYQTVYAKHNGSVAAPTAGLHFTDQVLQSLNQNGIRSAYVTLHVGAGTFKPVKSDTISGHQMHVEHAFISLNSLLEIHGQLKSGKPLVAVGTTSLRVLESLYWFGVKVMQQQWLSELHVEQWEPYEIITEATPIQSIGAIIHMMQNAGMTELRGDTGVLLAPGYKIRMANAIVTNFHQPKSTLILLIAAMIGEDWRKVYNEALAKDYRFLSYGDSSLLWRA